MKNTLINILIFVFIIYGFLYQKHVNQEANQNTDEYFVIKMVNKLKPYFDILTADPATNTIIAGNSNDVVLKPIDVADFQNKTLNDTLKIDSTNQDLTEPSPTALNPELIKSTESLTEQKTTPVPNLIKPKEDLQPSGEAVNTHITNEIPAQGLPIPKNPALEKYSAAMESQNGVVKKIYNIFYNILHTTQGRELLEKILLNPRDRVITENEKYEELTTYNNNSTIEVFEGEGPVAICGDIVTAHYVIRLINGKIVEDTHLKNTPKTFQIGDNKVIKGLEYAVLGMKKMGQRRLIAPPSQAYINQELSQGLVGQNEFITIEVELLEIKSSFAKLSDKIKIFNATNSHSSKLIRCGEPVYFTYKIRSIDEKIITKSEDVVSFELGSSVVPPAINLAFNKIRNFAVRTVILPSDLIFNQKIKFIDKRIVTPKKQMILFEIDTGYQADLEAASIMQNNKK